MPIIQYDVPTAFLDGRPASNSTGSFRTDGYSLWTYGVRIAHRPGRLVGPLIEPIVWDVPRDSETGRFNRTAAPRLDSATSNVHLRAVEVVINPDGTRGPLYGRHRRQPPRATLPDRWRVPTYYSEKGGTYR